MRALAQSSKMFTDSKGEKAKKAEGLGRPSAFAT
jgi:hypothetical protein